jgi:hypothetical protein
VTVAYRGIRLAIFSCIFQKFTLFFSSSTLSARFATVRQMAMRKLAVKSCFHFNAYKSLTLTYSCIIGLVLNQGVTRKALIPLAEIRIPLYSTPGYVDNACGKQSRKRTGLVKLDFWVIKFCNSEI